MVRLISRQREGLAALKLTKLFGIGDFPAAKDSGKVLIIIVCCYLIIIIIIIILLLLYIPISLTASVSPSSPVFPSYLRYFSAGQPGVMTTSRRFKCVPQILGSLSIHIFTLLFLLITYS